MSTVIHYIINMLPYMIMFIPVYLIIRIIVIKKKKIEKNIKREILMLIFFTFMIGLFSQTIIPKLEFGMNGLEIQKSGIHENNFIPFSFLYDAYYEVFVNDYVNYVIINLLGNIILFIPIGFLIKMIWNKSDKKVVLYGFLISLFIEFCQLFLTRQTDVDDLILNTAGTLIGVLLYRIFKDYKRKKRGE